MGAQQEEGVVVKRRKVAAPAADVTMDLDILDCPVCFHPLRPPIFQVRTLLVNLRWHCRNPTSWCTGNFYRATEPVEMILGAPK